MIQTQTYGMCLDMPGGWTRHTAHVSCARDRAGAQRPRQGLPPLSLALGSRMQDGARSSGDSPDCPQRGCDVQMACAEGAAFESCTAREGAGRQKGHGWSVCKGLARGRRGEVCTGALGRIMEDTNMQLRVTRRKKKVKREERTPGTSERRGAAVGWLKRRAQRVSGRLAARVQTLRHDARPNATELRVQYWGRSCSWQDWLRLGIVK
jgi:hypothetical protein